MILNFSIFSNAKSGANNKTDSTGVSTPLAVASLPAATSLSASQAEPVKMSLWTLLDSDSSDDEAEKDKKPEEKKSDEADADKSAAPENTLQSESTAEKSSATAEQTPASETESGTENKDSSEAMDQTKISDETQEKREESLSVCADSKVEPQAPAVPEKYRDITESSSKDSCELKLQSDKLNADVQEKDSERSIEKSDEKSPDKSPEKPKDSVESSSSETKSGSEVTRIDAVSDESRVENAENEETKVDKPPAPAASPVKDLEEVLDEIQRKRDEERAKYLPKEKVQRKKWFFKFQYVPTGEKLYRSVNFEQDLTVTYFKHPPFASQMHVPTLRTVLRREASG